MKASASWCTVCLGLLENKIPKPWKVSLSVGSAFIWQQQQNVSLFHAWVPFFFYRGSAKSSEPGNTAVYSENHLSVFTTFASNSLFSVQLLVLSTLGFYLFFACFLFFVFFQIWSSALFPLPATVDICSCSPTVQNCRRNVCPRSWHTWI